MPRIHQISSHHRGLDLAQQLGVTAHHTHIVLDVAVNFLGAKSIVAQFGSFMTFFGKNNNYSPNRMLLGSQPLGTKNLTKNRVAVGDTT